MKLAEAVFLLMEAGEKRLAQGLGDLADSVLSPSFNFPSH